LYYTIGGSFEPREGEATTLLSRQNRRVGPDCGQ